MNKEPILITLTKMAKLLDESAKNGVAAEAWAKAPGSIRTYCEHFAEASRRTRLDGVLFTPAQISVLFM